MRQSSNDDRRHGGRRLAPAAHILARLFGGIVDDLKWRLERTTLQDNMLMRRAMMLGATTIALSALWGSAATTARFDPCRAAPRKPRVMPWCPVSPVVSAHAGGAVASMP